jgi:hypothetical protein
MNQERIGQTKLGILICQKFCDVNEIPQPVLNIIYDKTDKECALIQRIGTCGYYRSNKITVAVPLCAHPNPSYSWPTFISDRTPLGVIQHELGHHVDEVKSGVNVYRTRAGSFFSDRIRAISGEKPITSYAPNTMEWFAEIFRLFVTNPDLLQRIRPRAYNALLAEGLKPIANMSAEDILEAMGAPAKVFERMENWIKNKK